MSTRSGTANLPLHTGSVPKWLAERMAKLGRVLTEAIVLHYGRDEFLRRLSNPFWFQSFGAVMGMDWHSSGITTSVMGALKVGLKPVADELGIYVCGGRGKNSLKTPQELLLLSDKLGLNGAELTRTSRLVAKVDNAAVQDGYQLYIHSFVLTRDGKWTVVQQGMNPDVKQARRYHWLSEGLTSFVDDPHAAVDGPNLGTIVNLADRRAKASRAAQMELIQEHPDKILREAGKAAPLQLAMPGHHDVRQKDVLSKRLHAALIAAHERAPKDFTDLLLTPGLGPRTLFTLANLAEVIHGTPSRFTDPARFSLALGGKDRHPYPVPLKVYDESLRILRHAIEKAKLGNDEKLAALKRLDAEARQVERASRHFDAEDFIAQEMQASADLGGMSVFGPESKRRAQRPVAVNQRQNRDLPLFASTRKR